MTGTGYAQQTQVGPWGGVTGVGNHAGGTAGGVRPRPAAHACCSHRPGRAGHCVVALEQQQCRALLCNGGIATQWKGAGQGGNRGGDGGGAKGGTVHSAPQLALWAAQTAAMRPMPAGPGPAAMQCSTPHAAIKPSQSGRARGSRLGQAWEAEPSGHPQRSPHR